MKYLPSRQTLVLAMVGSLQTLLLATQQVQAGGNGGTGFDGIMDSGPMVLMVAAAGAGAVVIGWRFWKNRQD